MEQLRPDHSQDEDRFIMLGMSLKLRVLVVCHCYRKDDTVIRIVSARKADKHEAKAFGIELLNSKEFLLKLGEIQ